MTLTEFLLARIAEDEAAAERGGRHNDTGTYANDNYGCLLVDPARVLAECEAKRRIVEEHAHKSSHYEVLGTFEGGEPFVDSGEDVKCGTCGHVHGNACQTLKALALPYADHADYRGEWRP